MTIDWNAVQQDFTLSEFLILNTLGSGGFGTCYEATYQRKHVCLKQLNRTSKKKAIIQSFQAETKTEYFQFHHPNIVKLYAASQLLSFDNETILADLFMVFEFIEGRNLQSQLDDLGLDIDILQMIQYGVEIASALEYVHSFRIAHLDLKPANVMITLEGRCKLADFGCSQYIEEAPVITTRSCLTGTFAYRAPELLRGGTPSTKCDVYALGICLWQFWSHQFPFSGMQQHAVIFRVVKANLRPKFDLEKEVNPMYQDLATRCWSGNPDLRPEMSEIIHCLKLII